MTDFKMEIPVKKGYTKKDFNQFAKSQGYEPTIIHCILAREDVCIEYIKKGSINEDSKPQLFRAVLISGRDPNSELVQKILDEILPEVN